LYHDLIELLYVFLVGIVNAEIYGSSEGADGERLTIALSHAFSISLAENLEFSRPERLALLIPVDIKAIYFDFLPKEAFDKLLQILILNEVRSIVEVNRDLLVRLIRVNDEFKLFDL